MLHKQSHERERIIPLLVWDDGFIRSSLDDKKDMQAVTALRVLPCKEHVGHIVPAKSLDMEVAARLSRLIRDDGLVQFAYKSDRVLAIASLLEEATKISGRQGIPTTTDDLPPQVDFPTPPTEDDKPDAPTRVLTSAAP